MPVINIVLSEAEHDQLLLEHAAAINAWPASGNPDTPPTFASWISQRMIHGEQDTGMNDIRLFNAIEKLVTSLPQHGISLVRTVLPDTGPDNPSQSLAQTLVDGLDLQPHYARRFQELFVHYLKNPKEIADIAQVGITDRAASALTEVHRQLMGRTSNALARLGAEKAIGRIEGATAILVGLDVMDRDTAKRCTNDFKAQAQAVKKSGWVGRIFGEP